MLMEKYLTGPTLRACVPWMRPLDYNLLCQLLRAVSLGDGHRFVALVAWSDSGTLLETIALHRCEGIVVEAIRRFGIAEDRRCAGVLARLQGAEPAPTAGSGDRVDRASAIACAALSGFILRDMYVLSVLLRQMGPKERADLRAAISKETRDATRAHGILEFASWLTAMQWTPAPGPRAYAAWLRRQGDIPHRLRTRAHAVEACFALRGGLRHAAKIVTADARPRQVIGRIGTSIASSVYALLLPKF
jgi:hypothetical protein